MRSKRLISIACGAMMFQFLGGCNFFDFTQNEYKAAVTAFWGGATDGVQGLIDTNVGTALSGATDPDRPWGDAQPLANAVNSAVDRAVANALDNTISDRTDRYNR